MQKLLLILSSSLIMISSYGLPAASSFGAVNFYGTWSGSKSYPYNPFTGTTKTPSVTYNGIYYIAESIPTGTPGVDSAWIAVSTAESGGGGATFESGTGYYKNNMTGIQNNYGKIALNPIPAGIVESVVVTYSTSCPSTIDAIALTVKAPSVDFSKNDPILIAQVSTDSVNGFVASVFNAGESLTSNPTTLYYQTTCH